MSAMASGIADDPGIAIMNLQLNLILNSEIRSGSNITRKFIIRMAAVSVPIIILGIMIPIFFGSRQAKRDLASAREEKKQLESVHAVVLELQNDLAIYERLIREVDGWNKSRLGWYEMLTELQMLAPSNVQFTRLAINETIEEIDSVPARKLLMMLKGKIAGNNPRDDIQRFNKGIKESRILAELMSNVDIRLLGASGDPGESDVWTFDATCSFNPRKMGENRPVRRRVN